MQNLPVVPISNSEYIFWHRWPELQRKGGIHVTITAITLSQMEVYPACKLMERSTLAMGLDRWGGVHPDTPEIFRGTIPLAMQSVAHWYRYMRTIAKKRR